MEGLNDRSVADDEVAVEQAGDLPWGDSVHRLREGDDRLAQGRLQPAMRGRCQVHVPEE